MKRTTRRQFVKGSLAAGLTCGLPSLTLARQGGPNEAIRIAVVGLGGIDVVGGVGGRGGQLIDRLREIPGVRVATLCDVDRAVLDHHVRQFQGRREDVAACSDLRKVLDDKTIDAVAIAAPNHWHALATVWACQAGKDVYVEKPFSYNIWEGRQMVAAARKFGRVVQVGTQRRSSEVLRLAVDYVRSGQLGPIRAAHALIYRPRNAMAKVSGPMPVPTTVDYDLWCGPAPKDPLMRKQLHYDWHWFWATGNGEIGNNGPHMMDVCRWALGQTKPPRRAMSIGGRFEFDDGGETANTQIAFLDYEPAPLVCEVRNVRAAKTPDAIGKFRNSNRGIFIDCEGGHFAGDWSGGAAFDKQGRTIQEFPLDRKLPSMETAHLVNFLDAVRRRSPEGLRAEAIEGHVSAACSHVANISYRLGKRSPPEAILDTIRTNAELADAFERCREYLRANGVDLAATQAVVGPWVTLDVEQERFVGEFADEANELNQRVYREPFVVPKIA